MSQNNNNQRRPNGRQPSRGNRPRGGGRGRGRNAPPPRSNPIAERAIRREAEHPSVEEQAEAHSREAQMWANMRRTNEGREPLTFEYAEEPAALPAPVLPAEYLFVQRPIAERAEILAQVPSPPSPPPPDNPPNAAPRSSPEPEPRDCVDLAAFYAGRSITVNPEDYPLRAFLKDTGHQAYLRSDTTIGLHSIAAASRTLATRAAFSRMASRLNTAPSLDGHGKLRGSMTIADICGYTDRTKKAALSPYGWSIHCQNYGMEQFTFDTKYGARQMSYTQPADLALLVDVYALDTRDFLIMWDNSSAKFGYYVAHHFNGGDVFGADVYQGVYHGSQDPPVEVNGREIPSRDAHYFRSEGAWAIDSHGKMYWQASPSEAMFPPHTMEFWNLFQQGEFEIHGRRFACYPLTDKGPFRVWEFVELGKATFMCSIPIPLAAAERCLLSISRWRTQVRPDDPPLVRWLKGPRVRFERLLDTLRVGPLIDYFLPPDYIDLVAASSATLASLSKRKYAHNNISDMSMIERAIAATPIGHAAARMRSLIVQGVVPDYAKLAAHGTYKFAFGPARRSEAAEVVEHVRTSPGALENAERLRAAYADEAPTRLSWRRWLLIGVAAVGAAWLAKTLWKNGASGIISGSVMEYIREFPKIREQPAVVEAVDAARDAMLALPRSEWFAHHTAGFQSCCDLAKDLLVAQGPRGAHVLTQLTGFAISTTIFAATEEIAKCYLPWWITVPVFSVETFKNYKVAGNGAFVTAGMHLATALLGKYSLANATLVHAAYNVLVSAPIMAALVFASAPPGMLPTYAGPALAVLAVASGFFKRMRSDPLESIMDARMDPDNVIRPASPILLRPLTHREAQFSRTSNVDTDAPLPLPEHIDEAFTMRVMFEDKTYLLDRHHRQAFYDVYERLLTSAKADARPVYVLMANNGLPHVPSNDDCNKFLAVVQRLAKCPYEGDPPNQDMIYQNIEKEFELFMNSTSFTQDERARVLQDLREGVDSKTHDVSELWISIIKKMGTKGRRYADHEGDLQAGFYAREGKISINFKSNESIARKCFGDVMFLVGRVIWNLPIEMLYQTIPLTRDMSASAHEVFSTERFFLLWSGMHGKIVPVMVLWAAGMTPEISIAFWHCVYAMHHCDAVFVRINGDDTQIIWTFSARRGRQPIVLNGDFSKFDQSQRRAFILDYLTKIFFPRLADKGLYDSDLFKERVHKSDVVRIYFKQADVKATLMVDPQMCTGRSTTSLGSFGDALPFCLKVVRLFGRETPEMIAESFGFNYKADWGTLSASPFLKMWPVQVILQDGTSAVLDMSMPGAVCKLGKSLLSPAACRKRNERRFAEGSARWGEAICDLAKATALSYGMIPDDYPVLGVYLKKMRSFSTRSEQELLGLMPREFDDGFREKIPPCKLVSREAILSRTCERYSCTVRDILEVERLIKSVELLPAFISHPVFDKMSRVDYG